MHVLNKENKSVRTVNRLQYFLSCWSLQRTLANGLPLLEFFIIRLLLCCFVRLPASMVKLPLLLDAILNQSDTVRKAVKAVEEEIARSVAMVKRTCSLARVTEVAVEEHLGPSR